MKKILYFSFPQLAEEDKGLIRRMIRVQRFQILKDILAKAKSRELSEDLGERAPEVCRYLAEMVGLSKQQPDQFWQVLDFWSTPFCLSRLAYPDELHDENHKDHIISNLSAILLFEKLLNGASANSPATYVTNTDEHGRVSGLSRGLWLEIQGERFRKAKVEWKCSPGLVSVGLAGEDESQFAIPIPLRDNPFIKLLPLSEPEAKRFPIISEATIFGRTVNRLVGAYENTGSVEAGSLPLRDSLTQAQETLKNLWPEVLEWADVLIPAFVDLGLPPNRMRLSTSYEPGSPIFMGQVDHHFFHAEDMVHEIQHHRLFLFADTPHFKSWRDLRQNYVSPYRPDPRHLRGIITGLHAFLTVNELRKRMIERKQPPEALIMQMAELHYENLFSFRTLLEHEEFGDLGRELFKQMAGTLAEHHSLIRSLTKCETEKLFEEKIRKHIESVQSEAAKIKTEIKNDSHLYRSWDETARLAANFS